MMKQKMNIDDILNDLSFTDKEIELFHRCVKSVKEEQKTGKLIAEEEIKDIVSEVIDNEI